VGDGVEIKVALEKRLDEAQMTALTQALTGV
jgi:hypothetical protein